MVAALERAVADLGLAGKRIAADEPRLAARLANVDVEDGYGLLDVRAQHQDARRGRT